MHVDRAQTRIHTLENGSVFEKFVTTVRPINKRVNLFFDDTLTDWPTHLFCYLIYAWCVFGLCHIAVCVSFWHFILFFRLEPEFIKCIHFSRILFTFYFKMIFNFTWALLTKLPNSHTHTHTHICRERTKEFTPSIWIPLQIYLHTFFWIV